MFDLWSVDNGEANWVSFEMLSACCCLNDLSICRSYSEGIYLVHLWNHIPWFIRRFNTLRTGTLGVKVWWRLGWVVWLSYLEGASYTRNPTSPTNFHPQGGFVFHLSCIIWEYGDKCDGTGIVNLVTLYDKYIMERLVPGVRGSCADAHFPCIPNPLSCLVHCI